MLACHTPFISPISIHATFVVVKAERSRVRADVNQVFVSENVVNSSTRNLSHAEVKVLSKGLNFCPTTKEIDKHKLAQDFAEFSRKMKCRAYFYR
jgi:hypothetical protein